MAELSTTVLAVLEDYAGEALNGYLYLTKSNDDNVFTVTSVAEIRGETVVETGIMVRIVSDKIVIHRDISNKPVVDALVQNGVPREQIILAYAGEAIPEAG